MSGSDGERRWCDSMDFPTREPQVLHHLKNLLAINLGFCDLLIDATAEGDPKRGDMLAIQKATRDAMDLLPQIAARLR